MPTSLEGRRENDRIVVAMGNDRLRRVFSDIKADSFRWQRMVTANGVNRKTEVYALTARKQQ